MPPLTLFVLGVLVVAWLAAGATAVRSVSRIWLRHWAERRLRGAVAATTYLDRPHRLLMAASAAISLVVTLLGLEVSRWPRTGMLHLLLLVAAAALVILFAGQIIPRVVARRWAAAIVPFTLPVLRGAEVVAGPLLTLGRAAAARVGPAHPPAGAEEPPEEHIQVLLREGELEGVGQREENAIITGVVAFGAKTARDVMTPRAEIFALPAATPPDAFALAIAQAGYSRIPVYRATLDDVVGMVHAFDVLKGRGEMLPPVRPVLFVAPTRPCSELLFEMLRQRIHLGIVRDPAPAGPVVGLVTLEDVLEELVGDIRDEHDEPAPPDQPPEPPPPVGGGAPPGTL